MTREVSFIGTGASGVCDEARAPAVVERHGVCVAEIPEGFVKN